MADDLLLNMQDRLREYFGVKNRPIVLSRAETDLLVRTVVGMHSALTAHRRASRPTKGNLFDLVESNQIDTDLILFHEIARKLRESEDR